MELPPRPRMVAVLPGCPELWVTATPGTLPCNRLSKDTAGWLRRLLVPWPATTKAFSSSLRETLITSFTAMYLLSRCCHIHGGDEHISLPTRADHTPNVPLI